MAKRKGSSKYRSARNGAKHSVADCAICSGKECRVIVNDEFEATLTSGPDGRTRLIGASPLPLRSFHTYTYIGSSRPVNKPLPEGYVGGWRRPDTGDLPIQTATLLAMQSLQTWGTAKARL